MHSFVPAALVLQSLTVLTSMAFAEGIHSSDIPTACATICRPVIQLVNSCDANASDEKKLRMQQPKRETDDDDDGANETDGSQCICSNKSFNVASITALCMSCIAQNGSPPSAGEITEIMSQCSFTSTSYAPAATSLVAGVSVAVAAASATSNQGQPVQTTASANRASKATWQDATRDMAAAAGVVVWALFFLL